MANEKITLSDINWRSSLPFISLFRAFRMAIHPAKLLLGLLAIVLVYMGGRALDASWPHAWIQAGVARRSSIIDQIYSGSAKAPFAAFLNDEMGHLNAVVNSAVSGNIGYPSGSAAAILRLVVSTPWDYWQSNQVFFTILFLWSLLVTALFGGAITRIAAVQAARDERLSTRQSLRFAWRKLPSFLGAPLVPIFTTLLLGALLSFAGLLLYLPVVGPIVIGLLLVVALAVGVLLSLLVIGGLCGWPLMYPTIAVEASDAFDATSRSYSYVIGSPWRLLCYWLVTLFMGAVSYLFVRLFVFVALVTSRFFVCWWVAGEAKDRWNLIWPAPRYDSLIYTPIWDLLHGPERVAAAMVCVWVYLFISLLGAFALSYFISSATIIYYLVRRQVDATELDEVFVDADEDEVLASAADLQPSAPQPPQTNQA